MLYKKDFYITKPVWNNAFSFDVRKNKSLFVPSIIDIDISEISSIQLQSSSDKVAFEDYDLQGVLSTNYWLKNFYRINYHWKEILLFDNHNHAYYFWYEARKKWIICDNNTLIHIDEHADTRDNNKHLLRPDTENLEKVFHFTNEVLNVGDYIIPAQEEWLIWEVVQIRNTMNLEDYLKNKEKYSENIILNLDLDFFQPDLDFINYNLKKKVILHALNKAKFVTVCTSPFFINQELALKVFRDIFWEK